MDSVTSRLLFEVTTILLLLVVALPIAYRFSLPYKASQVVKELCGTKNKSGEDKPRLRRFWPTRYTWRLAWRMPTYATASRYLSEREAIETRLNCSVEIWESGGLIWMRFGVNPLPAKVSYGAFYGS